MYLRHTKSPITLRFFGYGKCWAIKEVRRVLDCAMSLKAPKYRVDQSCCLLPFYSLSFSSQKKKYGTMEACKMKAHAAVKWIWFSRLVSKKKFDHSTHRSKYWFLEPYFITKIAAFRICDVPKVPMTLWFFERSLLRIWLWKMFSY